MGLFVTRWEADYDGHRVAVQRTEWNKGLALSFDDTVVAKKPWTLSGLGELEGKARLEHRHVSVRATIAWGGWNGRCTISVGGRPLDVRLVR